jgi:hypothetical protein
MGPIRSGLRISKKPGIQYPVIFRQVSRRYKNPNNYIVYALYYSEMMIAT